MTALRAVLERHGLPMALYTDRAHWAVHTPVAGGAPDRRRLTQVGRALARLGIEHILGYSPAARGRSERVQAHTSLSRNTTDAGRLAAMPRIQVRPIRLRTWFPPQDPVATMAAMLCVLREDLLLELYGITNEEIERLDDNHPAYRRTYFWRNSLRTLEEIQKVLTRLSFQGEFADAMAQEPEDVRTAFAQLKAGLNTAHREFLKDLRDTLGGHLSEKSIQTALDTMDPQHEAFFEAGETVGKTHYKFAVDLLWAPLLNELPEGERLEKAEEVLRKTSRLSQAVKAIDDAIACYLRYRRLP